MKKVFIPPVVLAMLLMSLPAMAQPSNFFNDTFGNGSTVNSATPAIPTTNSASYQIISSKSFAPTPSLVPNLFRYGIASSTGGTIESAAIFTTNTVTLTQPTDFIEMVIVFTNNAGILTASGHQLGIGLYNTGQTNPIAGGINGTASTASTQAGGVNQWAGYVGQILFNSGNSRIMTRSPQTSNLANGQDLVTSGSTSESYLSPAAATVGTAVASLVTLSTNVVYTDVLTINLLAATSEAITNTLYSGGSTNGTIVSQIGGISTNATFTTSSFDGLAFGWLAKAATTGGTVANVSSIQIFGQETVINGPPTITAQPAPAVAATNGYAQFTVAAVGFNVTYQWFNNNVALLAGGDYAGVNSSTLVISPTHAADAVVAPGYYCKVTGAFGFSTNSATNTLTLFAPTNLTWTGNAGPTWDVNSTASFQNAALNPMVFIGGDSVAFDDTDVAGSGNNGVTLSGNVAPSSMSVKTGIAFTFSGSGSIVGPGAVTLDGQGVLGAVALNSVNTFTGGTLLTNDVYVKLSNYGGFGNGPVNINNAGGTLEIANSGSATVGINGQVNILDDTTIQVDGLGTFAAVFLGDLSGTAGKTLTFTPLTAGTTNRFRLYGTNTVMNAKIVLDNIDGAVAQALYNGTVMAPYLASGTQTYNGIISGVGGVVQRGNGTSIFNAQNTYSGGTFPTAGNLAFGADSTPTSGTVTSGPIGTGPLWVTPEVGSGNGNGTVLAANGPRIIANPIEYPSATNNQALIVGGTNNITFSGNYALNGQDGTTPAVNRSLTINNTGITTISGAVTDGALGFGLIKAGTNALYLNGANTYTGVTTNTAGLLAGSGSLTGPVVVTTNATIGGGSAAAPGTLTINNNLTLTNAGGFFRVNRGGTSDQVSVSGNLVAGLAPGSSGSITVSNVGATLVANDIFHIFNKAVTGGASLPVTGGNVNWQNNLAVDGSIKVLSSIATYSTNLTVGYNGSTIAISWPSTHLGWILQSQTNSFNVGLSTNWVDVAGTASTTFDNLTVTTTNKTVFFRLRSPN